MEIMIFQKPTGEPFVFCLDLHGLAMESCELSWFHGFHMHIAMFFQSTQININMKISQNHAPNTPTTWHEVIGPMVDVIFMCIYIGFSIETVNLHAFSASTYLQPPTTISSKQSHLDRLAFLQKSHFFFFGACGGRFLLAPPGGGGGANKKRRRRNFLLFFL